MSNKIHFTGDPLLDLGLNTAMKGMQLYKEINEKIKQRKMSSNKPKYRLKKDLPALKAGAIFSHTRISDMYEAGNGRPASTYKFTTQSVETEPEWFEKVEEPKTWEILSYCSSTGLLITAHHLAGEAALENFHIHSVRRLSDGAVFKISDDIVLYDSVKRKLESFLPLTIRVMAIKTSVITDSSEKVFTDSGLNDIQHYKEDFKWTDELVNKFVVRVLNSGIGDMFHLSDLQEEFKKERS